MQLEGGAGTEQYRLQLELETNLLLTATTEERIQTSYTQIIPLLDLMNNLAVHLGGTDEDISVLAIYQAGHFPPDSHSSFPNARAMAWRSTSLEKGLVRNL